MVRVPQVSWRATWNTRLVIGDWDWWCRCRRCVRGQMQAEMRLDGGTAEQRSRGTQNTVLRI
jgi:hypothetical protein